MTSPALPDLFDCPQLRCRLTRRACVARQDVRHKNGSSRGERPSSHAMCDPSVCALGRSNRELVEQEQRDEAGIPLAALGEVDELDALDALDLEEPKPVEPEPTREEPSQPEKSRANPRRRCRP